MKKFLALILGCVALPLALTSCDDDNDLPDVDVTVNFDSSVHSDDRDLYEEKGEPITVRSIEVAIRDAGKKAIATAAIYYLNGARIGASVVSPLAFTYPTENLPVGTYDFNVEVEILAVDKTPAFGVLGYKMHVVDNISDIPGEPQPESPDASGATVTSHPTLHSK